MCYHPLLALYVVQMVTSVILLIVAMVTPVWVYWFDWSGWQQSLGLTWYCYGWNMMMFNSGCVYNWMNATTIQRFVLAFLIIAVLLGIAAVLAAIAGCSKRGRALTTPALAVLAALACTVVLTALIVWGVNMERNQFIGYSLWCAIAADIILLTAVFVALAASTCTKYEGRSSLP